MEARHAVNVEDWPLARGTEGLCAWTTGDQTSMVNAASEERKSTFLCHEYLWLSLTRCAEHFSPGRPLAFGGASVLGSHEGSATGANQEFGVDEGTQ